MPYAVIAVLLVLADQLTKYLTRTFIPLGGSVPFLPGFLDLTYVQNTGAAFSILEQHTWLLSLVSLLVVAVLAYLTVKGFFQGTLGRIAAMLILAGGMGNLLDRVLLGYVTDMIRTLFITFPVFNLADCCITVGAPLLFIYVLFFMKDSPEEKKPDGAAAAAAAAGSDAGASVSPAASSAEPAQGKDKNEDEDENSDSAAPAPSDTPENNP